MTVRFGAAVVAAVMVLAACGGEISSEEYRQKVAELALAQEQLLAAQRDLVAALESPGEADALLEEREAQIRSIINEIGFLPDPGRDPLEQLGALVVDLHGEIQEAQEAFEATEGTLPEAAPDPGVERARVDAYFSLISLAIGASGGDDVPAPEELEDLRPVADQTLDMEVLAGLDALIAAADGGDPAAYQTELRAFLQNVADFGMSANAGGRPPG